MIKEERQRMILERLSRDQKINLIDLSQQTGVSYDSIRRDVIELEDKGFLKKVHGGAVTNSYLSFKTAQGLGLGKPEVSPLIKKAMKLFEGRRIILLDGGTTNFLLAEQLPKTAELTIITNSLPLTTILADHPRVEVILLGGTYHKRYQITLGHEVIKQVEYFCPDLYVMGVNGVHPEAGLTLRHYEESVMKQRMRQVAKSVAVCALEEKLNNIENYKVCDLNEISTLVTTLKPTAPQLKAFGRKGIEVI